MATSSSRQGDRDSGRTARGIVIGALAIVLQGAALGLAANAVNPKGLPWVRVPLKDTHRVATSAEVLPARRSPARPSVKSVPIPPDKTGEQPSSLGRMPLPKPVQAAPAIAPKPPEPDKASPARSVAHPAQPLTVRTASPATKRLPARKPEALFTSLKDAKTLFDAKEALFIDARHSEDYAQEHITGARNLFADDVVTLYDGVLKDVPKDRPIVTYCSDPQCDSAIKLADALAARGHTRVFILLEGIPGWRSAGYPTTKGDNP